MSTQPVRSGRAGRSAIVGALVCVLMASGLVLVTAAPASAKVPRSPFRYTAKIEALAPYVGQSSCSPRAKPGTTAFANLLLRTYKNSRSLGISRSCSAGGTSEHKEGRAFDWGVSVTSSTDRASVQALLQWLLAEDRHGNRFAMARRLGIQYIIWNRRIWGSYAASSGWRRYTGSNPHTDHVHFSLSWAGARKRSSFWNPRNFPSGALPTPNPPTRDPEAGGGGGYDYPDPTPDSSGPTRRALPEPRPPARLAPGAPLTSETVRVKARRRAGRLTRHALVEGRYYLIEASGTYRYARADGAVADAECSAAPGSDWYRGRSLRSEDWHADHLDLYVDGHDLHAHADDGSSCDETGHTYRWVYRAERTGRVPFALWDPTSYRDNRGRLTVRVTDVSATPSAMTWTVPAKAAAGATSPGSLRAGTPYLVTVAGTWSDRAVVADAECVSAPAGSDWRRESDSYGGGDRYDVRLGTFDWESYVPRVEGVRLEPMTDTGDRCDTTTHTYAAVHTPARTGPLNLRVDDPGAHRDNRGGLTVTVRPYDGTGLPEPSVPEPTEPEPTEPEPTEPEPTELVAETVEVDSRSAAPVSTKQVFPAGTALRVTVRGSYWMREGDDWIAADAECTATAADEQWRAMRLEGSWGGRTSPLGDVAVNGGLVQWRPADGRGSCDERDHLYSVDLTTKTTGALRFAVADDHHADNQGVLMVTVTTR